MLEYAYMPENRVEADKYLKMAEKTLNNMNLYSKASKMIESSLHLNEGFSLLKKAADDGCIDAMKLYAYHLYNGLNGILIINKKESAKYFRMTADLGDTESTLKYAKIIDSGDGVKIDRKMSAKYFKMAADNGNVFAMYQYSKKVHEADGVKKDIKEQYKYLKMAEFR